VAGWIAVEALGTFAESICWTAEVDRAKEHLKQELVCVHHAPSLISAS
jgi:hypothetical protein